MRTSQYSISADSRRWWWPSATVGAAALAVAVAVPVAAGQALLIDRPSASTPADRTNDVVITADSGERPCVVRSSDSNPITYGPHPVCETERANRRIAPANCPPPPDSRYIGVPWVPYKPTGCKSLDRWWTMIERPQGR